MADSRLKEALRPLISRVSRKTIGNTEVLEIIKTGKTIKIPFQGIPSSSDTNTFQ